MKDVPPDPAARAVAPRSSTVSRRPGVAALLLIADALLFVVLVYKGIELGILGVDGVVARTAGVALYAGAFVTLLAFFALTRRLGVLSSREGLVDQILGLVGIMGLPMGLVLSPAKKGFTNVWIPLEWHKVALNVLLMGRISPGAVLLGGLVIVVLAWALARRGRLAVAFAIVMLLAWAGLSTWFIVYRLGSSKVPAYLIAFVLPLVAGALAGGLGFSRWALRGAVATAFSSLILWTYVGLLPMRADPDPTTSEAGFTHLYPRPGRKPEFDLQYMREFVLSRDKRFLFTCYGPSSGLVRIDVATGDAKVIEFPGLARYLWADPESDQILTMDWDKGDFLVFRADPFELERQVNILEDGRIAPWSFAVTPERIFVTFHELPILAEYDRHTLAFVRQLSMRDQGLTRFRSGLLKVLYDPPSGYLYAELGMTDRRDQFLLLKVDPKTLTIVDKAVLPEGGLDFVVIPGKNRLVAASFFSDTFHEYTLAPLTHVRAFKGPLNSRNVVYDPRRELLYSLAFLPGELWALDYQSSRIVKRIPFAKKAQSLLLDRDADVLWVGSQAGVFSVDLGAWIGS